MDASKITELRQKQISNYIHTRTPVDASVLTWYKQTTASRFMSDNVKRTPTNADVCTNPTNYNQIIGCANCSSESKITMQSNSVGTQENRLPNPTLGSGSATNVYSSDKITYYHAGNANHLFNPSSNMYVTISSCVCSNTNISSFNEGTGMFTPPTSDGFNLYLPLPKVVTPLRCGTTVSLGNGVQIPVNCVPAKKVVSLCSTPNINYSSTTPGTVFAVKCQP